MDFSVSNYDYLDKDTLYKILRLRSEVFVIEQKCIWLDIDGMDNQSTHIWSEKAHQITAYARILNNNITYPEASIGRVVVQEAERKNGLGRRLMIKSIDTVYQLFGQQPIRIMAQSYLRHFYVSLGFAVCSDEFDDFGIMHYYMIKP